VENESHSINEWFREEKAFDNYALNMKLTKPFFIRTLEACATLDVHLNMVEKARGEEHPPWIGNNLENIITRMMAVPKGTYKDNKEETGRLIKYSNRLDCSTASSPEGK
jgi:hypothetical protein